MLVDVITIFPGMFDAPMSTSIPGLAQQKGLLRFRTHDLRDHTEDKHRTTDDYPYGGGPGMVMKPEPLFRAVESLRNDSEGPGTVVFFTPSGVPLTQALVRELSRQDRLIMVCGRYEGFDERALSLADIEVSVGDYVLSGGEIPAMLLADAVARLLPGVLGDDESSVEESFSEGLLEYPQYTRPPVYRDMAVPDVLLSGDHGRIARWRRQQSVVRTARLRPDLIRLADLTAEEAAFVRGLAVADEQDEGI